MIILRKETSYQFIRFILVGISNTAVDFATYLLLTRGVPFFAAHIYSANTIAFIAAASWSYYANRTWTFKSQTTANLKEAAKFYTVTTSAFLVSLSVFYVLVHGLDMYDIAAKIVTVVVSLVWNFVFNKLWVFNR
jgi:putative flippase GtrA